MISLDCHCVVRIFVVSLFIGIVLSPSHEVASLAHDILMSLNDEAIISSQQYTWVDMMPFWTET